MTVTKDWRIAPLLTVLFLSIIIPFAALAEDTAIPLDRAIERFYAHNYDIIVTRYEIDKAQADLVGARLLPNPTVSLNYVGTKIDSLTPAAGDNTQLTLRLEELFELGGKRELRSAAARETLEAVRLSHKDTMRTLLLGFYNLFYGLKLDELNRELAEEELHRFDRTMEIAEKRFSAGHLSLVDYTKLRLARIDLENALTAAKTQLANDREQFGALLGSASPLAPVAELRESPQQHVETDLVASAQRNRYDLLALQKQLAAAKKNGALARAGRIPDVTVGIEYDAYGTHNTPTIGAGISVPLPLFNRNQGDIAHRNAEQGQIEAQLERVQRQIVLDVRQALNNSSSAATTFTAYRARKKDMDELLERSEQAFTLGGITVLDLLDTRKSHRDFIARYNQALVQSNLNEALLKVYTGELK